MFKPPAPPQLATTGNAPVLQLDSTVKFTADEKKALGVIIGRIEVLQSKMPEAADLKSTADVVDSFVDGKTDLLTASAVLAHTDKAAERSDAVKPLRRAIKDRINELAEHGREFVLRSAKADVEELAGKCSKLEKAERAAQEAAGIHPDIYTPSQALQRLRENHKAALAHAESVENCEHRITLSDLKSIS